MSEAEPFLPAPQSEPLRPGLVLERTVDGKATYQRVTHVFDRVIFSMAVSTNPADARTARRPRHIDREALMREIGLGSCRVGRLRLPGEFTRKYADGSEEQRTAARLKAHISPLLDFFAERANLHSHHFTIRILHRADDLGLDGVTLRRILLRYWYFGGVDQSLLPLKTGPAPKERQEPSANDASPTPKRRGPKPRLAKAYGAIEFVPGQADFDDMVRAVNRRARSGQHISWKEAHESYLATEFVKRHPKLAQAYAADEILCPVTLRQFTFRVKENERLTQAAKENIGATPKSQSARALHSTGPGDVYELDATGGQIFLLSGPGHSQVVRTPTIYLLIDRWSRYVVSAYITLNPPSWQALRVAIRIAFTSRDRRFKLLGFPIDDERWVPGIPPAQLASDRGAEMLSESMLSSAVNGLLIELVVLPALTPDGKAIVERVIRTLKSSLRARGTPGMYDKVQKGPEAKEKFSRARKAAVLNLQDLYRVLIEVVDEYNHAPHKSLRRRAELNRAGVPSTPISAYLWGLKNLTGIQRPPLTEEDYFRLTLLPDTATLCNGVVRYRRWRYFPANEAARAIAKRSTSASKSVAVAVDPALPVTIYSPATRTDEWPKWEIDAEGLAWYQRMTFEEEVGLAEQHAVVHAQADHDARRERVVAHGERHSPKRRKGVKAETPEDPRQTKRQESAELDRALVREPPANRPPVHKRRDDSLTHRIRALDEEDEASLVSRSRKLSKKE